jgi:hypothetical protein
LAKNIASGDVHVSKMLEGATQAAVKLDELGFVAIFAALKRNPSLTERVLEFVLSPTSITGIAGWHCLTKAMEKCGSVEVFELVFSKFCESEFRTDHVCCVLMCGALGHIKADLWPEGRQEEVFDALWLPAYAKQLFEWELYSLASACVACQNYERLDTLFSSTIRIASKDQPRSLKGLIHKVHPNLTQAAARRLNDVLNRETIDPSECLKALATERIPKRNERRNTTDSEFIDAGRVLMTWLINGLISYSRNTLNERVTIVMNGILLLKIDRRREAIFQLLARGHGAYARALTRRTLLGFENIASTLKGLPDDQLRLLFAHPAAINKDIRRLIDPPDFPKPSSPSVRLVPIVDVAALLLESQKDLFNGIHWGAERWLKLLAAPVDRLCSKGWDHDAWASSFQWFVETTASSIADLMTEDAYAHDISNEIERYWEDEMRKAADQDSPRLRKLRDSFVQRIDGMLKSRSGALTGPRKSICVAKIFSDANRTMDGVFVSDRFVQSPEVLNLWLMEDQRKRGIVPLIDELLRNVRKALDQLLQEDRLYRFEVTVENTYWARLSVRNSYDPSNERASSAGFGTSIITNLCKRLRSRDEEVRKPVFVDDVDEVDFESRPGVRVYEQRVFLPLA